jgi:hypothetical protein
MELSAFDIGLLVLVLSAGAWGGISGAVRVSVPFAARFGADPHVHLFGLLLLAFIGVVIFGFVTRILHGAVHAAGFGLLNRVLGLVMGTIVGGAVVWGLEAYGAEQAAVLMRGSVPAPPAKEFFEAIMGFLPRPAPQLPWWRRPWW